MTVNRQNYLDELDEEIFNLINEEEKRQKRTIQLIAAESITRKEVLYPLSSILVSKTAEGIPNNRYHSGCSIVDQIELLAEKRAKLLFNARKVWLQPLSGSLANLEVIIAILKYSKIKASEFKIMAMGLDQGGHLSHGSAFHISRLLIPQIKNYGVSKETGLLDYDEIKREAMDFQPQVLICGASAYPRAIDFSKMKEIAEASGAILISDISHIFGLIVTGNHMSPTPYSHYVTSSTYKAGGTKGGIIIAGDLADEKQFKSISNAIFPMVQSTPDFSSIAAKAVFFNECLSNEYKNTQRGIVENAKILAEIFLKKGFDIVTGGTDNHIILINVKTSFGLSGKEANQRLEVCGINVNKNLLPYDDEKSHIGSGIRVGTNTVTRLGMGEKEMIIIADFIEKILKSNMDEKFIKEINKEIVNFMEKFSFRKFF